MSLAVQNDLTVLPPPLLKVEPPHAPEDVIALENEGLFELVEGRLVEKKMAIESGVVAGRVGRYLSVWSDAFPNTWVTHETSFQCFPFEPTRIRRPDVAVIVAGRFENNVLPTGHVKIRPDIAIEVVSPNETVVELFDKLEDYKRCGVPLLWVIHPSLRRVDVRRIDGTVAELRGSDTLTAEPILPGFSVKVADLFPPVLTPPTAAPPTT